MELSQETELVFLSVCNGESCAMFVSVCARVPVYMFTVLFGLKMFLLLSCA